MFIYNVTVNIEDSVHEEWLTWMRNEHIPEVMKTGLFEEYRFSRVMVDEESGITYSVQYLVKDLETLKLYNEMYAPALQNEHRNRYEGKFVAFRTVMEIVHRG